MNLHFDTKLADNYTFFSQKTRILSEAWVLSEIYCPICGYSINDYDNNKTSARRAGWIGSNILLSKIPKAGHIFYIENGVEVDKSAVMEKWRKTIFLKQVMKADAKGWILDIVKCIDSLNRQDFTLSDMYTFENILQLLHPENRNIKPKIRQQLQFLRDRGYLEFVHDGSYRLR